MQIRIVGAGLIGTSLGLKLVNLGHFVEMSDVIEGNRALAQDLVGHAHSKSEPDLIVLATPIAAEIEALKTEYSANPQSMFIDISGIKSELIVEIEKIPELASRFCATHPMAGREYAGPTSAQADLFEDKPWIVIPTSRTEREVQSQVEQLIQDCGGVVLTMNPHQHDAAIAAISQLPQVVSSTLGLALSRVDVTALTVAGQGLRDVVRLASASGELWSDLLIQNREFLLPFLRDYQEQLEKVISAIYRQDDIEIKELFSKAATSRARIPGKHGAKVRDYTFLPIVIDDRPGQLAALFRVCGEIQANIEDLSIEHSPGQATGLITLSLSEVDASALFEHLTTAGWKVHPPRK